MSTHSYTPIRFGLTFRLCSLILVIVLLTSTAVGATVIQSSRSTLSEQILSTSLASTNLAAEYTSAYIASAQSSVLDVAARSNVIEAMAANQFDETTPDLIRFLEFTPQFESVSIVHRGGIVVASGLVPPSQIGNSVADREWFREVIRTGEPYLGLPVVSRATNRPTVPYAAPIYDGETMVGLVVGGIAPTKLSDSIAGLKIGPEARTALIDQRQGGIIVAHPDPHRVLTPVSNQNEAVTRLLAGESGVMDNTNSTGEQTLAAFVPVPDLPWGVLTQSPRSTLYAPIDQLNRTTALLSTAIVFVALVITWLLALRVTRPILQLRKAVVALADGDLSQRLHFTRRDEIGELGRSFDLMAAALSSRNETLKRINADLAHEIAERERAEEEVRRSEEHFRSLIENASDLTLVLAQRGQILYASPSVQRVLGFQPADLIGHEFLALVPEESTEQVAQVLRKARQETGIAHRTDVQIRHKDGEWKVFEAVGKTLINPEGNLIGVVNLRDITERTQMEKELRDREQALLEAKTKLEAANATLEKIAAHDGLTGVANRRSFDVFLDREWRRAAREREPIAVLLLDIDFFKLYNDSLGHLAGDDCLQLVAQEISRNVQRPSDLVARYGGEEFVVVLANTDLHGATQVAERIRANIESLHIAHPKSTASEWVTVSIGVASRVPMPKTKPTQITNEADQALYRAKKTSRNAVAISEMALA